MSENQIEKVRKFILEEYQISKATIKEVELSEAIETLYVFSDLTKCKIYYYYDEINIYIQTIDCDLPSLQKYQVSRYCTHNKLFNNKVQLTFA